MKFTFVLLLILASSLDHAYSEEDRVSDLRSGRTAGSILGPQGLGKITLVTFREGLDITQATEFRIDAGPQEWSIYFRNNRCTICSDKKRDTVKKGSKYGIYNIELTSYNRLELMLVNMYRSPSFLLIKCSDIFLDTPTSELEELVDQVLSIQI